MNRKMKLINEYLDGNLSLEQLVDMILRLEKELESLKSEKREIIQKTVWSNNFDVICNVMLTDNSMSYPLTQLKLEKVPAIGEHISITIRDEIKGVFKVNNVVNDIEVNKYDKSIKQEIMIFVSR